MASLRYILPATLLLLLSSCEKEFDIEYKDLEPMTVLEAVLTGYGFTLAITETTPMDMPMDRTLYTDADVELEDLTTGQSWVLSPDTDGMFSGDCYGISGHTYRLSVIRSGCSYCSECTMMQPVEILGMEFSWIKMPYDYVAVLQVSVKDNTEIAGECYWLRVYRNGEIYRQGVVRDSYAVDGRLDMTLMTTRQDADAEDDEDLLLDGDVVSATVAPISQQMYDYLEGLENNSNSTQMYEGDFCLGYFLAAPVSSASVVFSTDL